MKAITLYQPFAALIAIGAKRIETRSWNTNYRGPLAIHVSKRVPPEYRSYCGWMHEPFATALKGVLWDKHEATMNFWGQETPGIQYQVFKENLHLGCVIATCELIGCVPINKVISETIATMNRVTLDPPLVVPPSKDDPEYFFGDYTPGRYAWILANVKTLPEPIPAKGALGLWEWKYTKE
jgi:hypothetical protein